MTDEKSGREESTPTPREDGSRLGERCQRKEPPGTYVVSINGEALRLSFVRLHKTRLGLRLRTLGIVARP